MNVLIINGATEFSGLPHNLVSKALYLLSSEEKNFYIRPSYKRFKNFVLDIKYFEISPGFPSEETTA